MKHFVIIGDPVPWQRARISAYGNIFNAQKSQRLVTTIQLEDQYNEANLMSGPLKLDITFYMRIPRSRIKQIQYPNRYHTTIGDLDNYVKFICDAAQGILYSNDATISVINAKKVYDKKPRTEFTISSLPLIHKQDSKEKKRETT